MAAQWHFGLADGQCFATGHANLPCHQIKPGNGFCDRVFNLQASVHLHEKERASRIEQKLHSASPDIANGLCCSHGRLAHRPALFWAQTGGGGFFNDFLVAALDRAIAFIEVQTVAVLVGKNLNLNMPWFQHIFFNQHARVPKRGQGFTLSRGQSVSQLADVFHHFHAFATPASCGFEQHRIANALSRNAEGFNVLRLAVIARHQRYACDVHEGFGGRLTAHCINGRGGRAEEHQSGAFNGAGKVSVFR